jgi:hypothetical protein
MNEADTCTKLIRPKQRKSGAKKRILFLVDRIILADQTKTNDCKMVRGGVDEDPKPHRRIRRR